MYNRDSMWRLSKRGHVVCEAAGDIFAKQARAAAVRLLERQGIDVGPVTLLLEVQPFVHMAVGPDGSATKVFSRDTLFCPVQVCPCLFPFLFPFLFPLGWGGVWWGRGVRKSPTNNNVCFSTLVSFCFAS